MNHTRHYSYELIAHKDEIIKGHNESNMLEILNRNSKLVQ